MAELARLGSPDATVAWLRQRGARVLVADSRSLRTASIGNEAASAFLAWPGKAHDARRFVSDSLAAGACACVVEERGVDVFGFDDERIGALNGLQAAAGVIASSFFGAPSQHLNVLAVTGTNGKTSTAWWIAQGLSLLGKRCGVVGTLGVGQPPNLAATSLTTPDPVTLQAALKRFVDEGCTACAIEASSIGIVEQRLAGTAIKVALLTNFTQDHLDYHASMQDYWQAKAELFAWPSLHAAVLNIDDEQGAMLASQLIAGPLDVWTYSTRSDARLYASAVGYRNSGLGFDLHEKDTVVPVSTAVIGDYNVANLLATIGGLRALGVSLQDAATVCSQLTPAPGRMQRVNANAEGPAVIVDYAHTPDALEKTLLALRPVARARGGALWCVFGCGGDRDASKRPSMGAIAERLAARVVVTSDNPRHESPSRIISQIQLGINRCEHVDVIEDRLEAIAHALKLADARDVVLIAGKGHEDYQEIEEVKHPFSDVAVAQALLGERSTRLARSGGGTA